MKNIISIEELSKEDILEIFKIADEIHTGKYKNFLCGKSIVLFFQTQV